ncbi:putative anti-sigma-YlaC factor YlaD [Tamaricihabitans halophyticus]|uniref:Putative anti-sigma-YlaC factor YlaD n=1 Tax=Tamaricihabitans halophyticus TaxID=1262583 RepID=A0A4R2QKJ0_9PSEU|nr:zf-HC2 domain-containing protein [Tamaricihabitans halophyticus]TCP49952.1 putative anti-sigma-YlaC factor YlaD [Tamaricihabitans halophyticus]
MDCSSWREALSARLDNEEGPLSSQAVDQHLRTCASCQLWWQEANRLRRTMRLVPAPPVPDLSSQILAIAPPPRRERWGLRLTLAVIALVQCGLGFAQLFGISSAHGTHAGVSALHLSNESAAWNLAVGIGLLAAAMRPRLAAGLVPALLGFTVLLGSVSIVDLVGDAVTVGRVVSHTVLLAGVVLLILVHRQQRSTPGPSSTLGSKMADDRFSRGAPESEYSDYPAQQDDSGASAMGSSPGWTPLSNTG